MALHAGEKVDRYEVRDFLREGDYGAVYRGYAGGLSQDVAIVLLEFLAEGPGRVRFRDEARELVQLRHPNIHPVLDFGEHDGVPYIVQPLVQRATLAERRNQGAPGGDAGLRLLRGIAAAVDYAHGHAIVHGDLTPARVLLDATDRPLVTEFGMASLRAGTPAGPGGGDPLYAAPERVSRGELSADADRYAFATIAYEVMAGAAPFEGWPPGERASAQLSAQPPPASSRNRWLDQATDAVLLRGLAKDPQARWQSCGQLVEALGAALASQRPADAPPMAPARPWPTTSRRRGQPWLVAGAVGLVLVAAAITIWLVRQPASPTPGPSLTLSQFSAVAGQRVTLRASHLPAGQVGTVQIQSSPTQIGTFQADGEGNLRGSVTIPADTRAGDHVVSLCWSGSCPARARLIVLPAPGPSPSQTPTPSPTATASASPTPTAAPTPSTSPTASS